MPSWNNKESVCLKMYPVLQPLDKTIKFYVED